MTDMPAVEVNVFAQGIGLGDPGDNPRDATSKL
jgi:hypothetical protein